MSTNSVLEPNEAGALPVSQNSPSAAPVSEVGVLTVLEEKEVEGE